MATRGVYHQNDKTVKRRNTIQLGLLIGGTRRASSLPGRCCFFPRASRVSAWPAPVHCNFEAFRSAAPRCRRRPGCRDGTVAELGFALAIGAGTGRPHGGQHRHRGPWPVRVTQTMAEPPSSPMAAWGLRLVNRSTSSPLWLGLLSGSTFFSAFREHNVHVHAHDYDHNHQSPPACSLYPKQLRKILELSSQKTRRY